MTVADEKRAIISRYGDLLARDYPRFTTAEMARRRDLFDSVCRSDNLDAIIIAQSMRAGTATFWLTGWPVTQEAVTLIVPGQQLRLFIQHFNHLPLARRLAADSVVEWGETSGISRAFKVLHDQLNRAPRIGVVGTMPPRQHDALSAVCERLFDLNPAYTRFRLIKSEEEVRWLRLGAAFTDLGISALAEGLRPGLNERELAALVEGAYTPLGGSHGIRFFGVTPMDAPAVPVPAQFPSSRPVAVGDVLTTEISAQFWDYGGQVLRTFAIGKEPNQLYRELHEVAEKTLAAVSAQVRPGVHVADLVAASSIIEEAGFTIIDDLVHGYGGGYLPPVLGSASRQAAGGIPDIRLEAGMALVVQPNVVTRDLRAGVQTGHLFLVTESGAEPLQAFPGGLQVLQV